MKAKHIALCLLAAALILGAVLTPAWAYFTTQTKARGGYTLANHSVTEVEEQFHDWIKEISITNREGSGPVFVRARAFAGSTYELVYSSDGNWYDGQDGWWYYAPILPAQTRDENGQLVGGVATGLSVQIQNIPTDPRAGDSFNVVVVFESTPVLYTETGETYADWTMILDTGESTGGSGG